MEDLTGNQFGQYQIVGPLGEGGMAAVYKADQPAMERFVAVSQSFAAENGEFLEVIWDPSNSSETLIHRENLMNPGRG